MGPFTPQVALGHAAEGYTVLALADGQPDLAQIDRHCAAHRAEDPIFCSMGNSAPAATSLGQPPVLADARVRAVVALSPLGAVFKPASLASLRLPALVYLAAGGRFLVPRIHGQWLAAHSPAIQLRLVPGEMHFAFMDTPSMPIPSEEGDFGADAPGFDRAAFLRWLGLEPPAFFEQTW